MEGRGKPVRALLTPFPATLSSTKRAIKQFEELKLYTHFIAFSVSDRRTEQYCYRAATSSTVDRLCHLQECHNVRDR
eukprot:1158561-Pelagomonas_calceolata.AAC.9